MKILLIAPVVFPCGTGRYGGIERLVWLWAGGLAEIGHKITVACGDGSRLPPGVTGLMSPGGDFVDSERAAYYTYRPMLKSFDFILDFSHSHWAMRDQRLKSVCWCWHTPSIMQPPLPDYSVLTLTVWHKQQLRLYQNVDSEVFDPHCGIPPGSVQLAENYFVFIGRLTADKGGLQAIEICRDMEVPLVVIGGLGPGDTQDYLDKARRMCTEGIEILGNVSDSAKNEVLARAKALIYPISYANKAGEAHSHKSVDSLLAGVPVVAYRQGALPEVIEHDVDGFLAENRQEFIDYMLSVNSLDREDIHRRAIERWAVENVIQRAVRTYSL